MKRHLAARQLEGHGRARTFNKSATSTLEHRFDTRPLDVLVDGVTENFLQDFSMRSVDACYE